MRLLPLRKENSVKNSLLTLIAGASLLLSGGASYAENFEIGFEAYERGDFSNALRIFRLAAEQRDYKAQYNLGVMYRDGQGVLQDDKEAVNLFRMSAEQGFSRAQYNLGWIYYNGQGVPQDYREAVKWYRMGAEQEYQDAQLNLGFMYLTGAGVRQDKVYAHMWWSIAASNGGDMGARNRDRVVKEMTKDQIAKAQRLARECVKKNYKDC